MSLTFLKEGVSRWPKYIFFVATKPFLVYNVSILKSEFHFVLYFVCIVYIHKYTCMTTVHKPGRGAAKIDPKSHYCKEFETKGGKEGRARGHV